MRIGDFRKLFEEGKLRDENGKVYDKWDFAHYSMEKYHSRLWDYAEYIKDTDITNIIIGEGTVFFKLRDNDIILECKANDERSMPMDIINFRTYEKEEMDLIDNVLENLIKEGGNILDIGANIGFTSIHWGKCFQNANIYAFEPMPPTYDLLRRNIEANKVDRVKVYNWGLSNKEDKVMFTYYPWCTANSSIQDLEERADAVKLEALIKKYDGLAEFQDIRIDFVKCDVEGNEKFVFEGMEKCLRRDKPVVCAELLRKYAQKFGYHPNEVLEFFKEMGYVCYGIGRSGVLLIDDMSCVENVNFLFLNREKHANIIHSIITE